MGDDNPTRRSRRTWIYVVAGVLATGVMLFVAAVVAGIVLFRTHVHTESLGPEAARGEFERALGPFASQVPLVDERTGRVRRPPATGERRSIDQLRVMLYDPDDEELTSVTVPGWLLRLAPHGRSSIKIGGVEVLESDGEHISVDELERSGPGLILDRDDFKRGGRVVVWAE